MRINRTNPEQPAAQPVQSHAPLKAQTEVNGFELPEQEIPKENQKEPPKAAKPPKPKKEKPAKKPRRRPVEEVEDDEENEQPRRHFPFGCLIVLVILALVGFGGYKVSQFYAELDGQKTLGPTQTITVPEGSSVAGIATQLKDAGVIEYDWLFKQYVKYSGKAGEIQYGDFEVQSGMAYNDIIKALSVVTRRATVNVTIPEGTTAVGVAQIFVDAGLVDDVDTFLSCANGSDGTDWSKYDFWNAIPDNDRLMKCEGYLFPDTYNLYKDESVAYYVDALYGEFASKTADLPTRPPPRARAWTTWSSWPASSRRRPVWRARTPGSAPASTTAWNPATRSGPSTSWNPTPAAISCRTARTTICGTPRRRSTSAGRSRAQFPMTCWPCTTPTPSAVCPQAPSPARATPPWRPR